SHHTNNPRPPRTPLPPPTALPLPRPAPPPPSRLRNRTLPRPPLTGTGTAPRRSRTPARRIRLSRPTGTAKARNSPASTACVPRRGMGGARRRRRRRGGSGVQSRLDEADEKNQKSGRQARRVVWTFFPRCVCSTTFSFFLSFLDVCTSI
ncbi:hypothetical protein C8R45DRAFT_293424, partial [Mycena sanguinolenta]